MDSVSVIQIQSFFISFSSLRAGPLPHSYRGTQEKGEAWKKRGQAYLNFLTFFSGTQKPRFSCALILVRNRRPQNTLLRDTTRGPF